MQKSALLYFSLLIITMSFLPVLLKHKKGGCLSRHLRLMLWPQLLHFAITLVPVVMGYFIRGRYLLNKRTQLIDG